MPNGIAKAQTAETEPAVPSAGLPLIGNDRDVRSKKPPALSFLLRMDTARLLVRVVTLLALDYIGISLAIFTALVIKAAVQGPRVDVHAALVDTQNVVAFAYLVTVLLFARSHLYAPRALRPGFTRVISSLFQVTVVALIFALVNHQKFQSYYIFYASLFFAAAYISALRWIHERASGALLRVAGQARRAVLVGMGQHIDEVAHALGDGAQSPVEVVGCISLTPRTGNGLRSLGTLKDLPRVLDEQRVQEVIIAAPDFPQTQAVELVDECHRRGVRVRIAPTTMELLIQRAEFVPGQSVPLFELRPPVFEGVDFALKRTFDIVVASLLLIVLAPLMLAIALAIRVTSRGPALFRSVRPGIGGANFNCLKFRTMHTDAEQRQADLELHNEASGALFKIRDDPRLTRIGRLLRRFSLDELPQLFNVLRNQMSLVGPRPLPLRDFEQLEDWHKKRYLVLPGVTGLWQVSGRAELNFDELVRLDFLYLERWSVFLDLTILLKTLPAVISRRGAF
ncbi:MAG TPA: sugar transferase [Solirubrobacteraceae bacterium]|nr:sugar transferase [Solirubrobacteraceae bacterium]